jgi:hypothetical protein
MYASSRKIFNSARFSGENVVVQMWGRGNGGRRRLADWVAGLPAGEDKQDQARLDRYAAARRRG